MAELLDKNEIDYYIPKRDSLIQQIVGDCEVCAKVNAGRLRLPLGVRARGHRPGIHWEIDFTEIKPGMYNNISASVYRHLLRMGRSLPHEKRNCSSCGQETPRRNFFPNSGCLRYSGGITVQPLSPR